MQKTKDEREKEKVCENKLCCKATPLWPLSVKVRRSKSYCISLTTSNRSDERSCRTWSVMQHPSAARRWSSRVCHQRACPPGCRTLCISANNFAWSSVLSGSNRATSGGTKGSIRKGKSTAHGMSFSWKVLYWMPFSVAVPALPPALCVTAFACCVQSSGRTEHTGARSIQHRRNNVILVGHPLHPARRPPRSEGAAPAQREAPAQSLHPGTCTATLAGALRLLPWPPRGARERRRRAPAGSPRTVTSDLPRPRRAPPPSTADPAPKRRSPPPRSARHHDRSLRRPS